jgi:hypothetical protein
VLKNNVAEVERIFLIIKVQHVSEVSQINLSNIAVDVVLTDLKDVHLSAIPRQAVCASRPIADGRHPWLQRFEAWTGSNSSRRSCGNRTVRNTSGIHGSGKPLRLGAVARAMAAAAGHEEWAGFSCNG